jgi:hypothetical protein
MSKYIKAEDLRTALLQKSFYPAIVAYELEHMPVANVVEVVRCKDCKHSKYKPIIGKIEEGEPTALLHCTMFIKSQHIYEDDFCSYGERKADNEN